MWGKKAKEVIASFSTAQSVLLTNVTHQAKKKGPAGGGVALAKIKKYKRARNSGVK